MDQTVIEKNASVEVFQVTNGYLVKLPYMLVRGDYQPIEGSMVFQSFAALVAWMAEHFSHRDMGVMNDAEDHFARPDGYQIPPPSRL